jgi:sugar lactone lactonase YvrE
MACVVEVAFPSGDTIGEGPWWSVAEQALWRVDINGCQVYRWDPADDTQRAWALPDKVGCAVPCKSGTHCAVALADGIHLLDLETSELSLIVPLEQDREETLFNDGKCDRSGNFWLGSKHVQDEPHQGSLYKVDRDGSAMRLLDEITTSNGIGWSPDDAVCYYTDSGARTIWSMEVDETGVRSCEVFATDTLGVPDGLTVDTEGYVWSAKWDGGRVVRYAPTGDVDLVVEVPVSRPTSVMFGGADLTQLFITSARIGVESEPLAGHVFVYASQTRGLPEAPFDYRGQLL